MPQPIYNIRHHLQDIIYIFRGIIYTKTEEEGALSQLVRYPHSDEHV